MLSRTALLVSVFLLVGSVLARASVAQALTPVPVKQVAAPPSDIVSGRVKLPDPVSIPVVSRSAMIAVELEFTGGSWSWSLPMDVGSRGARIALLPSQDGAWDAELITPTMERIAPDPTALADQRVMTASDSLAWVAPDRDFTHMSIQPNQQGVWTLSISSDHNAPGFVLVDSGFDAKLSTHTTTLSTIQNQPITLEASFDQQITIQTLNAEITSPSGITTTELTKPGASSVTFFADEAGPYSVRIIATGTSNDGRTVLRTTQHLIHAAPQAPLLGSASIEASDEMIRFVFDRDPSPRRAILAAEVWGKRDGVTIPVAWISTIVSGERSLALDTRWIALSGVDPESLELRAVRLHDIESFVPIEMIDRVRVPVEGITLPGAPSSISDDMLTGNPGRMIPSAIAPQITQSVGPGHRLMLVHGYCTDAVPFTVSHFSGDLAIFEDFEQSRSHDEFALQMLAQSAPAKSFGVVAHSQGGMAALHLKAYYWSGLDWARGGRLIQTVGAPYQGTALAGNAAVLGDIFGFGCGQNDNMSYAGSASWMSLIPTSARQEVYYYTTSFEDGFGFDYCNFITDLLLSDPDDGVIERDAGQLPGAHNMGHLEGWCHTADMRDPGQCTDQSRNTIMNTEAKR